MWQRKFLLLSYSYYYSQGEEIFLRVEETNGNAVFTFTVERCWSTPAASPTHATKDEFFANQCGVDKTV